MRIVIVSAFWNAENYIERCIRSVMEQEHANFKMYLIDDLSTDGTVEKIRSAIGADERFELIVNREKKFKLRNLDNLIRDSSRIGENDVIVELDGDDWLYDSKVVFRIHELYRLNPDLWMTSGSFVYSTGKPGFAAKCNVGTIRWEPFVLSHLRTWKAFLWRAIKPESFLNPRGECFRSAGDVAYAFPLLELAGQSRYQFVPEILYVYNEESPLNEHKPSSSDGGAQSQKENDAIIRRYPAYQPLRAGYQSEYQRPYARLTGWSLWRIRVAAMRFQRLLRRLLN